MRSLESRVIMRAGDVHVLGGRLIHPHLAAVSLALMIMRNRL